MASIRWLCLASVVVLTPGCVFDAAGAAEDGRTPDAAPPDDASSPDARPKVSAEVLTGLDRAQLASGDDALIWARGASAPQVFFLAYLPIYQADQLKLDGETCPDIVSEGNVRTYTGGCMGSNGDRWSGTAIVTGPVVDDVPGSITYDDFGHTGSTTCGMASVATETLYTGTVLRGSSLPALPIVVDLVLRVKRPDATCAAENTRGGIDYEMTLASGGDLDANGTPDTRTFDGHGRVGKRGGEHEGFIAASTSAEVTGEACSSEALAGLTTLVGAGHTVTLHYDGATDCEGSSTVGWDLDGAAQGELAGIVCTIAPGGRRGAAPAALLFGLALLVCARRRHGPRTRQDPPLERSRLAR